jgi:hypothetical protein
MDSQEVKRVSYGMSALDYLVLPAGEGCTIVASGGALSAPGSAVGL